MTRPKQFSDELPKRCCVSGCRTVVHSPKDADKKLFRFVRRGKAHSVINPEFNELIERRFWEWINVLGQNPRKAPSLWICSEHFVSGRPSASACHWEIDWIPNRKLRKKQSANRCSLNRIRRQPNNRNANGSILQVDQSHEEASFSNQDGPFCRLCLRKNVNLRPVFPSLRVDDNYVVRVIEQVANIHLEFEADYNSFVCCDCFEKLEDFNRCREIWQSNDVLVRAVRTKESSINPVPIDHLVEEPAQVREDPYTFNPAPIPIVAIPIEHLIVGPEASIESLNAIAWQSTPECNDYDATQQSSDVLDEVNDTKNTVELLSDTESTFNHCLLSSPVRVDEEPYVEHQSDTSEKEMMIRKLMKKITRETLSSKKKKSKKRSKRKKREVICSIDIDEG